MTASELLRQTWELVRGEGDRTPGYYHRRLSVESTFPAYAGLVFPDGSCRLSLLADSAAIRVVSLRDETKGYTVEVESSPVGHPGASFVHITAKGPAFTELFAILATDVLEQWAIQREAKTAIASVHRRLQHWRRFFARGAGGLSREEYIGLYAELTLLEVLLGTGIDADHAVNAWQGPCGTNQDYLFGSKAIEVKGTTGNDADTVRIANERQLDMVGLQELFLFHIALDFRENTGRTLDQEVAILRGRLDAMSAPARLLFDERLLAAGYINQVPSPYAKHGFTERKHASYKLREGFPRIVESVLPPGVTDVSYHLDLSVCSAFQVSMDLVIKALKAGV